MRFETMHSIIITRESGYGVDRLRPYDVFIDDKRVLNINEGECKQLTVSPGSHSVSLRVDWCRSHTLQLNMEDGQSTELWCWPKARIYTWPFFLTLGWNRYITLSPQPKIGSAPSVRLFRTYQLVVLIAIVAFLGYESVLGNEVAIILLIILLAASIVWLGLLRARASKSKGYG
jgi:hypothetical protein